MKGREKTTTVDLAEAKRDQQNGKLDHSAVN